MTLEPPSLSFRCCFPASSLPLLVYGGFCPNVPSKTRWTPEPCSTSPRLFCDKREAPLHPQTAYLAACCEPGLRVTCGWVPRECKVNRRLGLFCSFLTQGVHTRHPVQLCTCQVSPGGAKLIPEVLLGAQVWRALWNGLRSWSGRS